MTRSILTLLALLVATVAADPPTWWGVPLEEDESLAIGKAVVFGGAVGPGGVHTYVKGLDDMAPVEIMLMSHEPEIALTLGITKEDLDIYLKEEKTDEEGLCSIRFRTSQSAYFRIQGEQDAEYTVVVWAGPKFEPAPPAVGTSMKEYRSRGLPDEGEDGVLWAPGGLPVLPAQLDPVADPYTPSRRGTIREWLKDFERSRIQPENKEPWKKRKMNSVEAWNRMNKALQELRERVEKIEPVVKAGHKPSADALKHIQTGLDLMEHFGIIDPREAAIQPDYEPEGMPDLPSRNVDESRCSEKCNWCYRDAQERIQRARRFLENNYTVHRQTMMEVGRIKRLIAAAESVHGLTKLLSESLSLHPSFDSSASEKAYFKKYRGAQQNGLKYLNEALISMGDSEKRHWDAAEWYSRYGLHYYLFFRDRYVGAK